jgi:hypothetical protein
MSVVPLSVTTRRWQTARVWLVRLAGNLAGFAVCLFLAASVLWAVGANVFAPLVPHAGAFYREGDGIMYTQNYLTAIAWVSCVPAAICALVIAGVALWRRWLWFVPGVLLGLALGTIPDALDVGSQQCGGGWHHTPQTVALLANGLCLVVAARPATLGARCKGTYMPGSGGLRMPRAHRAFTPLALLLALAGASLAGCEINAGHRVGDTISNADLRITLTSVTEMPAHATFQPAAGDELVRLHVRYANHSHTALGYAEVMFAMPNGAASGDCGKDQHVGCIVPLDGTYNHLHDPRGGPYLVQPGATIESDILFEVGKSAHNARLVFAPDGMEDIANFWWLLVL